MKIFVMKEGQFQKINEGRLVEKGKCKLRESSIDANIESANGVQDAMRKARDVMARNSNVTSASADAGKIDGENDKDSGEGMKLELPVNANGKQLSQAQHMVQNQSNDDMQISFTKPQTNGAMQNENRIAEMRKNCVEFTKKELNEIFLKK